MYKNKINLGKKEIIEILVVCLVMGIGMLVHDYISTSINFDGTLKRQSAGQGNVTETLEVTYQDKKEEIQVEVSEQGLSKEEIDQAFDKAIKEIDETYLGKNKSANHVMWDLNLKSSYQDGLISAYWKSDRYDLISGDGKINQEEVPDEGDIVNLIAELSYKSEKKIYSFSVVVYPISLETQEGKLMAIKDAVKNADESTIEKPELALPNKASDMNLQWKKKMNFRGLQLMILGVIAVVGLLVGQKKDAKKARQQLVEDKESDYPMIISELSILLGAGMSFRKALERIVTKYQQKKSSTGIRPGYEDMAVTYRKMVDGMGEIAALEDLGFRSESKEYRKLAMLLSQNLKKGSRDLLNTLEKEEAYAFEMRKQKAIRAGEEASTKLLIPMAGMLFIVIVILIVPALMQMKL